MQNFNLSRRYLKNVLKEAAKYKQELEEVTRELNKKNETLEILENKINEISTNTDKSIPNRY